MERIRLKLDRAKEAFGTFFLGLSNSSNDSARFERNSGSCFVSFSSIPTEKQVFTQSFGNVLIPEVSLRNIGQCYIPGNHCRSDVVEFVKRGEDVLVHFDWLQGNLRNLQGGYHLDQTGKKAWFLFCRTKGPLYIMLDTTVHCSGYVCGDGSGPLPRGLNQPTPDVEKKLKLLTAADKNCPFLLLAKRVLHSLRLPHSVYQTGTGGGGVKAICYCVTCTTQRKEKTKLIGWAKFYIANADSKGENFRYFRPVNKGTFVHY